MKKYDVISIGDVGEDIFVTPEDSLIQKSSRFSSGKSLTFELGEKINLEKVSFHIGGSAGNTAIAFSRLGLRAAIVSSLGFDSIAEKVINRLSDEKVSIDYLDQSAKRCSNFSVIFNFGSERTIFVYHGLTDYSKIKIPKNLSTEWLYVSPLGDNYQKILDQIVTYSSQKSTKIAWNPGVSQIKAGANCFRNLLSVTDILSLNKEEAIKFTNYPVRPNILDIAKKLNHIGAKVVLITDGKNGAHCFDGKNLWYIGILPAERIDATGAGDSFTAAFTQVLIKDGINRQAIEKALKYAIVESTSVISSLGAQTGLLDEEKIEETLNKLHRLKPEIV